MPFCQTLIEDHRSLIEQPLLQAEALCEASLLVSNFATVRLEVFVVFLGLPVL
jgi:hypothetical protein